MLLWLACNGRLRRMLRDDDELAAGKPDCALSAPTMLPRQPCHGAIMLTQQLCATSISWATGWQYSLDPSSFDPALNTVTERAPDGGDGEAG
jgi:hypothetical protein